jgi:hypothetical protein
MGDLARILATIGFLGIAFLTYIGGIYKSPKGQGKDNE